jgi:cysteinyl-tRNA synthetase
MSMKLLGKTLDIHGGGLDLQFPHHENELAQSESYTGVPFVRYWMHNGLMKIGGEKVSKTHEEEQKKKATLVVSEAFQKHDPETVRFLLLATHYRRPIDYGEERLQETRRGVEGFYRFFERFQRIAKTSFYELRAPTRRRPIPAADPGDSFTAEVVDLWKRFLEHMDDDFNTGGAIGILYEMLTTLNRFADARQLEGTSPSRMDVDAFQRAALIMKELTQILGIFHTAAPAKDAGPDKLVGGLMQLLIDLRAEARKAKNFALGDQIRKRLTDLGVTLEDRAAGTSWRVE